MWGYSTFVFKSEKSPNYKVYFGSNYWIKELNKQLKKKKSNLFKYFSNQRSREFDFQEEINQDELNKLKSAHSSRQEDKNKNYYSKFAGDMIFLLDLTNKTIKIRGNRDEFEDLDYFSK